MIITLSLLAAVDVFKSGADGYNCYRIPSMITLPSGRIFAFAEGRLHDCYDGPNHALTNRPGRRPSARADICENSTPMLAASSILAAASAWSACLRPRCSARASG